MTLLSLGMFCSRIWISREIAIWGWFRTLLISATKRNSPQSLLCCFALKTFMNHQSYATRRKFALKINFISAKRASSLSRSLEDFLLSISWSCNAGKTFPSCKKKTQTREEKFGVNLLPAVCARARRSKLNPQLRADGSWIGRERERK